MDNTSFLLKKIDYDLSKCFKIENINNTKNYKNSEKLILEICLILSKFEENEEYNIILKEVYNYIKINEEDYKLYNKIINNLNFYILNYKNKYSKYLKKHNLNKLKITYKLITGNYNGTICDINKIIEDELYQNQNKYDEDTAEEE